MTVITKALVEKVKAGDKLEQPLVVENASDEALADPEAQNGKKEFVVHKRYLILRSNTLRPSVITTLWLFLIAIIVSGIGIIGGVYIYRLYARDQMHRFRTGWYSIPYDGSNSLALGAQDEMNLGKDLNSNERFFKERFEIDLQNGHYEKIEVPDFRDGRQGRFIHDFNMNKTGIIDIDGRTCFVMALDRQRILPPLNMYDCLRKMYNGYFDVNTKIVRLTMKIVTPAITDMSIVGIYIARECQNMATYLLEPIESNVVKRSASDGVYGLFAGTEIIEIGIPNLNSILEENK